MKQKLVLRPRAASALRTQLIVRIGTTYALGTELTVSIRPVRIILAGYLHPIAITGSPHVLHIPLGPTAKPSELVPTMLGGDLITPTVPTGSPLALLIILIMVAQIAYVQTQMVSFPGITTATVIGGLRVALTIALEMGQHARTVHVRTIDRTYPPHHTLIVQAGKAPARSTRAITTASKGIAPIIKQH